MTRNLASVSNEFKLWLHAYNLILILRMSSEIIDIYLKYIENAAESESFSFATDLGLVSSRLCRWRILHRLL